MADNNDLILTTMKNGELTISGEFVWGSNYTFLVEIQKDKVRLTGVYKPTKGERELWDFPQASLAKREVAAYLVSEALGWRLVPPTVYRIGAPLGPGSIQLYINHDPEYHYFTFSESDRQRLRPSVLFDLCINNADRKGSHVLIDSDGHLWLIDHGVCFHEEDKLRTVIWDFIGEPIPPPLAEDLKSLANQIDSKQAIYQHLEPYLEVGEIAATSIRIRKLLSDGIFPDRDPHRRPYPWPPV
jgi:uncharacterized repeat protein (TIGR03843 family)